MLNLLAAELSGAPQQETLDALGGIAHWACEYLAAAGKNSGALLAALAGCTHFDMLASGASFSTAYKSALVLREVPKVIAVALDCADYTHGWAKAIRPGHVGIALAPEYREQSIEGRAVKQILDRSGRVILITSSAVPPREGLTVLRHPTVPERFAPLAQAVICDAMIGAMNEGLQTD